MLQFELSLSSAAQMLLCLRPALLLKSVRPLWQRASLRALLLTQLRLHGGLYKLFRMLPLTQRWLQRLCSLRVLFSRP